MHLLTRATITRASRIMLPAHALLSGWIGVAWVTQGDQRTNIPALFAVRAVWPIWGSGAVLAAIAAAIVAGLLLRRRRLAAVSLGTAAIVYFLLGVANTVSILVTDSASYSAPAWPFYVAVAHAASMVSLAFDEFTDRTGNRSEA